MRSRRKRTGGLVLEVLKERSHIYKGSDVYSRPGPNRRSGLKTKKNYDIKLCRIMDI